ncbi:MAG: carboxymuconolactone decarboxylase family protein [Anaerolineales bacterium]|nr:carboxymuconolactone decarboxylase family protein [Anaerolineales bacterium]
MDARTFSRRIFTYRSFIQAIDDLLARLPDLKHAARGGRVSKAFSERIMLAVTQVNGCRYCYWGHSLAALKAGIPQDQIDAIISNEFMELPAEEVPALLFAQHYAETEGHPDPEAWDKLVEQYTQEGAQDILAYIRMITFGNLWGNSFDALLSRFGGKPAPNSSLLSELGIIFGSVVILPFKVVVYFLKPRT